MVGRKKGCPILFKIERLPKELPSRVDASVMAVGAISAFNREARSFLVSTGAVLEGDDGMAARSVGAVVKDSSAFAAGEAKTTSLGGCDAMALRSKGEEEKWAFCDLMPTGLV